MDHGRGFSIHRLAPASRRGLFLVGLALAVFVVGLPASAHTPETGADPSVTLTVTPSDNVHNGESVAITGFGFPVLTDGVIRQCGGPAAAPQCDPLIAGQFRTGATQHLPRTLVVARRYINTGTTTFNCGVQQCFFVATAGTKTSQHHIGILGAGTSVAEPTSTSPTTSATTVPTATTAPTATTIPTSSTVPTATTTTALPQAGLLCDLLGALRRALGGFLGGLLDGLMDLFNCPPAP
jgi:hypothetical protein